jgi:hypothetical protein
MSKNIINLDGGTLTDVPNDYWKKFFIKFEEINDLEIKNWKVVHVLSYFCKKYNAMYGREYKFKFNTSSPTKCFEVFQVKRLSSSLSSNPEILKSYIDWVFESKVIKAKKRITSISFLNTENFLVEYKKYHANHLDSNQNILRTSSLPEKYKNIFKNAGFEILTYGDLAFLSKMSDMPLQLIGAFQDIEDLGFNSDILNKVV